MPYLIMKLASCSSVSTVTPTPPYTSSLFLAAGQYWTHITRMKSKVLVTITMQEARSCQTILQKSGMVDSVGPWVTMYALGWTRL